MAIKQNSAEGGTDGVIAAGLNGNTPNTGGASGDTFDTVTGAVSFSAVAALRGSLGYRASAASIQYTRWGTTDTKVLLKSLFRWGSLPANTTPVRIGLATSSVFIAFTSNNVQLFWSGSARANSPTNIMAANTVYRMALWADTAAGSIRCSIYKNSDNTLVWDSGAITGLSGMAAPTEALVGKYDTSSIDAQWDQVVLKTGADGAYENDPFADPLPTPVVTLGATVNPTTSGGTDGKQTVSWPAVAGAASYDARIATTSGTPAESDYTTVATGVGSPYQFTGLSAGARWYGIKARI